MSNRSITNTTERVTIYNAVKDNLPSKISKEEAIKTLELLSVIISRSYRGTLTRLRHLLPMINHCFEILYNEGLTDLREIKKQYITIGKAIEFGWESHSRTFCFDFVRK